jgi:hypothetical protein
MVIQWKAEKYPPVGRCIYCGSQTDLTDEHIIPFALLPKGGDWFLPKSSCEKCACITKQFEGAVCGAMFGPFREQLGLKSRRKKTGQVTVRYNYPDGSLIDKVASVAEFPQLCMGLRWPIPGILSGEPPTSQVGGELVVKYDKAKMEQHATETQAFRIGRVGPLHFARMLAKIAHAFTVARYGLGSFDPLLLPLILGTYDQALFLVGGDASGPLPDQPSLLHDVFRLDCRRDNGPTYLSTAIRLFAMVGMPRYHVIVGHRLKEAPPGEKIGDTKAVDLPITAR